MIDDLISDEARRKIELAIHEAESKISAEIRVHLEDQCSELALDRAAFVFEKLEMHKTEQRNGVLIYIAMESRKFAIFGDEGIHKKMGFSFWTNEAATLKSYLSEDNIVEGVCKVAVDIGEALKSHFPHQSDDKNELPDAPVYGK